MTYAALIRAFSAVARPSCCCKSASFCVLLLEIESIKLPKLPVVGLLAGGGWGMGSVWVPIELLMVEMGAGAGGGMVLVWVATELPMVGFLAGGGGEMSSVCVSMSNIGKG